MFDANELYQNSREYEPGKWGVAKPLCYPGDGFWSRLKDAWAVLLGNAAAVRWY